MVNSGSLESDRRAGGETDRNEKAGCTQPHDATSDSTHSPSPVTASTAALCKPGFSRTADGHNGPPTDAGAQAIGPTPTQTEFNNMPIENVTVATDASCDSPSTSASSSLAEDDKNSLCCSLPLDKVQGVLTPFQPEEDAPVRAKPTRKLLCLYCDRSFASANLRQKHVERVHFVKQNRRVSSRRQNQLTVTPCTYCDKLNSTENTLKDLFQHLVNEHSSKYFGCLPCEDRFLNSSLLADHDASVHQNAAPPPPSPATRPPREVEKSGADGPREEAPTKVTRSRLRSRMEDSRSAKIRNKKLTVKSTRIALKKRESKRIQALEKAMEAQKKKRSKHFDKKTASISKPEQTNSTKTTEKTKSNTCSINPYPEFDNFYRVKKITDHSIDNLKISSLTFDDVFDKAFFNRIKCNIEENLLHHIDGKLFKNEESESRISNFEKVSNNPQEAQHSNPEHYGCELSLNAVTPVASLSLNSQYGEDFESQIEYGSKPSKKKTQIKTDEVHYKYFTRRKYQASILQHKENRDLSKLDMWTQLVIKKRQQKMLDQNKSAKEMMEYTTGNEYRSRVKRQELNRILDRRGPFEDLKEEASKKAALDKLNRASDESISHESFTEVREVLNEILNRVFAETECSGSRTPEEAVEKSTSSKKQDNREIPGYLNLRRSSTLPVEGDIDRSDKIALICSSQETENFELPTNQVRRQNELIELSGEWARCRMYICAACGAKLPNMKYLLDHKSMYHQYVWVQHYEFVGNQSELYRHLSIPALGKVGKVEETVACKLWKRSDARVCTKCGKQCNSLGELHRHVLECGGDWTWMLVRKKCKYRPYGAKSRRKRRGLVSRIHQKQKTEPTEKKKYKKSFEGPRQRPSDADTIQRMLANLPAKRSTRKLISLHEGIYRARKTNQIKNQKKVKCGKMIYTSSNIKENTEKAINTTRAKVTNRSQISNTSTNKRSLRSLSKVLSSRILDTSKKLSVKRKLKVINERRKTRQNLEEEEAVMNEDIEDKETEDSESSKIKVQNNELINNKRSSPRSITNKMKKMSVKKILTSKINMKSFFPVKKKKNRNVGAETNASDMSKQSKDNDNSDPGTRTKRRSKEPEETSASNSKETLSKAQSKKNKIEVISNLVRSLSITKRNRNKKQITEVISSNQNIESNNQSVTQTKQESKEAKPTTQTKQETAKSIKKRKLKPNFKSVINRVKKLKIDTNTQSDESCGHRNTQSNKVIPTRMNEITFLDKSKQSDQSAVPQEKIVIPSTLEAKENIADISETALIATNLTETKENPPIPENMFQLESKNEEQLQAKGELNFDTKPTVRCSDIDSFSFTSVGNTYLLKPAEKFEPITVETSVKPKTVPLISPNLKGKIRKPARGLNDCIAMLTSKLQQQKPETVTKVHPILPPVSPNKTVTDPIPHKPECILKIPTFRTNLIAPAEEALDLTTKKKVELKTDYPVGSFYLNPPTVHNFIDSIDKTINDVVENKCNDVHTMKWQYVTNTVDETIQNVIDDYQELDQLPIPINTRNSVDDIIDFVVTYNLNDIQDSQAPPQTQIPPLYSNIKAAEKPRKIGSIRKPKNKEELPNPAEVTANSGKSVEIIFEKNAALEVNCKLNIINLNKKNETIVSKAISELTPEINIKDRIIESLLGTTYEKHHLSTSEDLIPVTQEICKDIGNKHQTDLNEGFLKSIEEPKPVKKRGRPKKIGEIRVNTKDRKTDRKSDVLETNLDNLLSSEEINTNPGISTSPISIQGISPNDKEVKLYNEDEPHVLESKTLPNQDKPVLSDSDEDIPLSNLIKVDKTVKAINKEKDVICPTTNDEHIDQNSGISKNSMPLKHVDNDYTENQNKIDVSLLNADSDQLKNYEIEEILIQKDEKFSGDNTAPENPMDSRTVEVTNAEISFQSIENTPQDKIEKTEPILLENDILKEHTNNLTENIPKEKGEELVDNFTDILKPSKKVGRPQKKVCKATATNLPKKDKKKGRAVKNNLNSCLLKQDEESKLQDCESLWNNKCSSPLIPEKNCISEKSLSDIFMSTSEILGDSSLFFNDQSVNVTNTSQNEPLVPEFSPEVQDDAPNLSENKNNSIKQPKKPIVRTNSKVLKKSKSANELFQKPTLRHNLNSMKKLTRSRSLRSRSETFREKLKMSEPSRDLDTTIPSVNNEIVDTTIISRPEDSHEDLKLGKGDGNKDLIEQDTSLQGLHNNAEMKSLLNVVDPANVSSNEKIVECAEDSPLSSELCHKVETKKRVGRKPKIPKERVTTKEFLENLPCDSKMDPKCLKDANEFEDITNSSVLNAKIAENSIKESNENFIASKPKMANFSANLEKITIKINRTEIKSTIDGTENDFSEFCIKSTSTPKEEENTVLSTSSQVDPAYTNGGNLKPNNTKIKTKKPSKQKRFNRFALNKNKVKLLSGLENSTKLELHRNGDIQNTLFESTTYVLQVTKTEENIDADIKDSYLKNNFEIVKVISKKGRKRQKKVKSDKLTLSKDITDVQVEQGVSENEVTLETEETTPKSELAAITLKEGNFMKITSSVEVSNGSSVPEEIAIDFSESDVDLPITTGEVEVNVTLTDTQQEPRKEQVNLTHIKTISFDKAENITDICPKNYTISKIECFNEEGHLFRESTVESADKPTDNEIDTIDNDSGKKIKENDVPSAANKSSILESKLRTNEAANVKSRSSTRFKNTNSSVIRNEYAQCEDIEKQPTNLMQPSDSPLDFTDNYVIECNNIRNTVDTNNIEGKCTSVRRNKSPKKKLKKKQNSKKDTNPAINIVNGFSDMTDNYKIITDMECATYTDNYEKKSKSPVVISPRKINPKKLNGFTVNLTKVMDIAEDNLEQKAADNSSLNSTLKNRSSRKCGVLESKSFGGTDSDGKDIEKSEQEVQNNPLRLRSKMSEIDSSNSAEEIENIFQASATSEITNLESDVTSSKFRLRKSKMVQNNFVSENIIGYTKDEICIEQLKYPDEATEDESSSIEMGVKNPSISKVNERDEFIGKKSMNIDVVSKFETEHLEPRTGSTERETLSINESIAGVIENEDKNSESSDFSKIKINASLHNLKDFEIKLISPKKFLQEQTGENTVEKIIMNSLVTSVSDKLSTSEKDRELESSELHEIPNVRITRTKSPKKISKQDPAITTVDMENSIKVLFPVTEPEDTKKIENENGNCSNNTTLKALRSLRPRLKNTGSQNSPQKNSTSEVDTDENLDQSRKKLFKQVSQDSVIGECDKNIELKNTINSCLDIESTSIISGEAEFTQLKKSVTYDASEKLDTIVKDFGEGESQTYQEILASAPIEISPLYNPIVKISKLDTDINFKNNISINKNLLADLVSKYENEDIQKEENGDMVQSKDKAIPLRRSRSQKAVAKNVDNIDTSNEIDNNADKHVKSHKSGKLINTKKGRSKSLTSKTDKKMIDTSLELDGQTEMEEFSESSKKNVTKTIRSEKEENKLSEIIVARSRSSRNRPVINYAEDDENLTETNYVNTKVETNPEDNATSLEISCEVENKIKKPRSNRSKNLSKKEKVKIEIKNENINKSTINEDVCLDKDSSSFLMDTLDHVQEDILERANNETSVEMSHVIENTIKKPRLKKIKNLSKTERLNIETRNEHLTKLTVNSDLYSDKDSSSMPVETLDIQKDNPSLLVDTSEDVQRDIFEITDNETSLQTYCDIENTIKKSLPNKSKNVSKKENINIEIRNETVNNEFCVVDNSSGLPVDKHEDVQNDILTSLETAGKLENAIKKPRLNNSKSLSKNEKGDNDRNFPTASINNDFSFDKESSSLSVGLSEDVQLQRDIFETVDTDTTVETSCEIKNIRKKPRSKKNKNLSKKEKIHIEISNETVQKDLCFNNISSSFLDDKDEDVQKDICEETPLEVPRDIENTIKKPRSSKSKNLSKHEKIAIEIRNENIPKSSINNDFCIDRDSSSLPVDSCQHVQKHLFEIVDNETSIKMSNDTEDIVKKPPANKSKNLAKKEITNEIVNTNFHLENDSSSLPVETCVDIQKNIFKIETTTKSQDNIIKTMETELIADSNKPVEPPIKIIINKHKTRRKSKSFKKVDHKGPNDLFEDFALVIKKPKGTAPIITFTPADTFSKGGDSNDMSNSMEILPRETQSTPETQIAEINDESVEEMDMELDEIPITTNIIERSNLDISLPAITSKSDKIQENIDASINQTFPKGIRLKRNKGRGKVKKTKRTSNLSKKLSSITNDNVVEAEGDIKEPLNEIESLTTAKEQETIYFENIENFVTAGIKTLPVNPLNDIGLFADVINNKMDTIIPCDSQEQKKSQKNNRTLRKQHGLLKDDECFENLNDNTFTVNTSSDTVQEEPDHITKKFPLHTILVKEKDIDKIYAFSDTEDIEKPLEIPKRLPRIKTKSLSETADKNLTGNVKHSNDFSTSCTDAEDFSKVKIKKTRSDCVTDGLETNKREGSEDCDKYTSTSLVPNNLRKEFVTSKRKFNRPKELSEDVTIQSKKKVKEISADDKIVSIPTNITELKANEDPSAVKKIKHNKEPSDIVEAAGIDENFAGVVSKKPIRSAKVKALENIHDDAVADFTENEKALSRKTSINEEVDKNVDTAKKIRKSKKNVKTHPIIESLEDKTPLLADLVADLAGLEELENSIERELNAEKELSHMVIETEISSEDVPNTSNLDSLENQELRRSRRSRKVASYNESDLVDPLLDEISGTNKGRKKESVQVEKENALEKKMNSDELFDLLKASTSEVPVFAPKPPVSSFPTNFVDFPKDKNNDNLDNVFENILEKSSLLIESNIKKQSEPKDVEKVYEFSEEPEISNKENELESRADVSTKINSKKRISSDNSSVFENSLTSSSCSQTPSTVDSEIKCKSKKNNYCEICNKSFIRVENLIKHKRTLTHIQKLSEIEAKLSKETPTDGEIINENLNITSSVIQLSSIESSQSDINISNILNDSEKPTNNSSPIVHSSFINNHSLKLADIINDVLNKPDDNNGQNKFPETMSQCDSTLQPEYKRYKSLGERKSFDSDKIENHPIVNEPFISKTTILEKQICLLENIIEKQTGSYIDDISMSSNGSGMQSNSGLSLKNDNTLPNIRKPNCNDDSFLKPTQYEEISEDSTNLRNYEDQKLRKTLNRDEELFLECCSLLKSGSEVSSYSNKKSQNKITSMPPAGSDWLEQKHAAVKAGFDMINDYSDDNSRIPTPLGDSYDDDASDSNTISSNWEMNRQDDELNHKERLQPLNTTFNLDQVLNKVKEHNISAENRKLVSPTKLDQKADNTEDLKGKDHKRVITKGARKVFEGLKVSIPTEELNMEEVLNSSPKPKKHETEKVFVSPTEKQPVIISPQVKPSRSARKSKPVKKSQIGSNLLFKVNKNKTASPGRSKTVKAPEVDEKVSYDVYDFEETQDNSDIFTKPDFRAFRNLKSGDNVDPESDTESRDYLDPCSIERESITSTSVSSLSSLKKTKAEENITKKKCMIMGRIFKNAAKSKIDDIDEEIRSIPIIDNDELVESYVANCKRVIKNDAKPKLTETEINQLFDQLLENKNAENADNTATKSTKSKTDSKKAVDVKKKSKLKNRKRARTHSDSTDDEFKLNNTIKRVNRKNAKAEDNCINLEQELKECIGVASRKSQRKCTSGKQNVLVEYWSSDESQFEALLESQKIESVQNNTVPKKTESKINIPSPPKDLNVGHKGNEHPPKEVEGMVKPIKPKKTLPKKKSAAEKKEKQTVENIKVPDNTSNRRKRAAVNPLYHWSSSSEDESQDLIEVKPIRDEIEDDEDRPIQHGWIVGDSPKKLVTMLAQAKGKKTDIDGVKEQGKKRTNAVS